MNLETKNGIISIHLEPTERLWSVHVSPQIDVSLDAIQSVQIDRPKTTWKEIKAPGTYIFGFKAGTYYTERGREFWYAQKGHSCLCLDMEEGYYKRIVLGSPQAEDWCTLLQSLLS